MYNSNEILVNENTNTLPNDLYGTMHLSREKILKDYIDDDKKLTILRPTLIYGKGDTHNSYGPNRFLKQAKNESIINIFGKGLDKRDHMSVWCLDRLFMKRNWNFKTLLESQQF